MEVDDIERMMNQVAVDAADVEDLRDAGGSGGSPERALCNAVMREAFHDILKPTPEDRRRFRKVRRAYLEARRWVASREGSYPFSFERVCEALGWEPDWVRKRLARRLRQRNRPYPQLQRGGRHRQPTVPRAGKGERAELAA